MTGGSDSNIILMGYNMKMNKNRHILLTAALLFFVVTVANASALGRFSIGVKGGLNSYNLRIESETTISSYQTRSGFVWGGFIAYRLSDLFSLQVEVLDSAKGTRLLQAFSGANSEITLMYQYTEVPLLIKLAQGRGGRSDTVALRRPLLGEAQGSQGQNGQPVRGHHGGPAGPAEH